MASRYIVVDDADSRIQYTGPWFSNPGSDSVGNFGPPFRNTMHGTTANASLSFPFNGTRVRVFGSNNIRNDSGVLDPTWDCFVDNTSIGTTTPFQYPENNWVFCEADSLLDVPHILTVNATVIKNQTFWFDDIYYLPSASVPLDQASIFVDSLDPQLQYGQGWQALGGSANMTVVNSSIFIFNFIGVSLSWYGFIPHELPIGSSTATYSIDGQSPITFLLKGLTQNTTTVYNQQFFETAQLSAGPHTLKVVHQGSSQTTPLTLDYLVVQNGTQSSTTTSATSATTGNGVSDTSAKEKSSTPVGAIAGGVIGGLALIFAILVFLLLRRRQKRTAKEKVLVSTPQPFDYTPLHPSSVGGVSYSEAPQMTQMGNTVTYGTKEHPYHASMPSVTSTELPQSIVPPSTSSGGTSTNRHPVPLQHTALAIVSPSSSSPPTSGSSVPTPLSPPPPSSKVEREVEALATLRPQRRVNPLPAAPVSAQQSNDSWSPSVVLHEDSGIRMPSNTASRSIVDVPPLYTPD